MASRFRNICGRFQIRQPVAGLSISPTSEKIICANLVIGSIHLLTENVLQKNIVISSHVCQYGRSAPLQTSSRRGSSQEILKGSGTSSWEKPKYITFRGRAAPTRRIT